MLTGQALEEALGVPGWFLSLPGAVGGGPAAKVATELTGRTCFF